MRPSVNSRPFGILPNGQGITAWTLVGRNGLVVEVIDYGAIVTRLLAPDCHGLASDVVLGFNDFASYIGAGSNQYFGAIAGRVAGRIKGASFDLAGRSYRLSCNEPPNHLHGGYEGFDKKLWTAAPADRPTGEPALCLNYSSPDGEEGYPGTVNATVTYTVSDDNRFVVETEAVADQLTPFSLTHHSYFNLGGEGSGDITDHRLQIYADDFIAANDDMTLSGQIASVVGRPGDFRQPRRLGDVIPLLFRNHGDLYRTRSTAQDHRESKLVPVALLAHQASGRTLAVSTTEKYLQLYTGVGLDGSLRGKSLTQYDRHAGLCLECQGYPDGANNPSLGDIVLRPGVSQCQMTEYAFSAARCT